MLLFFNILNVLIYLLQFLLVAPTFELRAPCLLDRLYHLSHTPAFKQALFKRVFLGARGLVQRLVVCAWHI
jgi:hypothetical protein